MRSSWIQRQKRRHRETEKNIMQRQAEIGSMLPQAKKMPKIAGSHHNLGARQEINSPSESTEGIQPDDPLISDFWPFAL